MIIKNTFRNILRANWIKFPIGSCISLLIVFYLGIYFNPIFGQSGYSQIYDFGSLTKFKAIITDSSTLYVYGVRKSDSFFQSALLMSFDTSGILNWQTEIIDSSSSITVADESGIIYSDKIKRFVLPFGFFHRSSIGLAFVNMEGQLINKMEYVQDSGSVSSPADIVELQDGFIITGWKSSPPYFQTKAFALKIDKNGNQKWMKEFGNPTFEEISRNITLISPNLIILSGTRFQRTEPKFSHGWMIGIDTMGIPTWEWEADQEDPANRGVMSILYDSLKKEFIYITFNERKTTFPGETYDVQAPLLVRRDSNLNLINYFEYGPYAYDHYLGSLIEGKNNYYIASGGTTKTTDDDISPIYSQSGKVIKVLQNGDIKWGVVDTAVFDKGFGSQSYLSGISESPYGSVYSVGWANEVDDNGILQSIGWIIKIDSEGCIDTLCSSTGVFSNIQKQFSLNIYPNPARDILYYKLEWFHDLTLFTKIYNSIGSLVHSEISKSNKIHQINLSNFPGGIYYMEVDINYGISVIEKFIKL